MFENSLTIASPFGISVFGSGLIRVAPDIAVIRAGVSKLNEKPSIAFAEAREGAKSVRSFLSTFAGLEFGTSRIRLAAERRLFTNENRIIGYRAFVGIQIQLRELDLLEEISVGLVESGAHEITAVDFQVSELKKVRARARTMAIEAAREKARLFASSAGIKVGKVIHIQDVSPQIPRPWFPEQVRGHGSPPTIAAADAESGDQFLDPSAIEVNAAVLVAYSID